MNNVNLGIYMKKYFNIYFLFSLIVSIFLFSSCNNEDNPESPFVKGNAKTTILIYAVASNNLDYNLASDKREILSCYEEIDLEKSRLFLYEVTNTYEPVLCELKKRDGGLEFTSVKEYDSSISSLETSRMNEVIMDVKEMSESEKYGLILWSHGTGMDFYPETKSLVPIDGEMTYSFGYDKNPSTGTVSQMNIDKLAQAIPDNFFDFIWFDACYMSGIETIYELRNKCKTYIGYPTEVFEWGMPYNLVMPYLMQEIPDFKGGAQSFFNYYAQHSNTSARVATVAVVDMSQIENLAELCKEAYLINGNVNVASLQKYTRGGIGPYYDLNGYMRQLADFHNNPEWTAAWEEALDSFIIFKASTNVDFNYNKIDLDQFSGISSHIFKEDGNSVNDEYFKSLDWYIRVFRNE